MLISFRLTMRYIYNIAILLFWDSLLYLNNLLVFRQIE